MKFVNPLPFVKDIGKAKAFYADVLGLEVIEDHGDFVKFANGFALHDGASLLRTIYGKTPETPTDYGAKNLVLYFEVADLEAAFQRVSAHAEIIHPIQTQAWGQSVFRFHDLDGHIVEIGEPQ